MTTRPWLIFFSCVLAVVCVIVAIKQHSQVQAPMRWSEPMPNPNGFDTCVKASEALVEKRQIAELVSAAGKPGERLADLPAKAEVV